MSNGLLGALKDWLKKAKDRVNENEKPASELDAAFQAANVAIQKLNDVLDPPEPSEPSLAPPWDKNSSHQQIGACIGLLTSAEHLHNHHDLTGTRQALVTTRWAIDHFRQEVKAPKYHFSVQHSPPEHPTGASAIGELRKWLEKAKDKVNQGMNPTIELVSSANAAQTLIDELEAELKIPAPLPPSKPLDAGSMQEFMDYCMAYFDLTDLELGSGNKQSALQSCVLCKWAIVSFTHWLPCEQPHP